MSVWKFLWNACWREAGTVTRAIQIVSVTIPFLLTVGIGLAGGRWSKDLWPAWVWLTITFGATFLSLVWGVFRRAYELEKHWEAKIVCSELRIQDDGEEQHVRVSVHNASSQKLEGLQASVERIFDSEGSLTQGEITDPRGDSPARLDYPIQLFTQERLRDRRSGGDKFVRPFNLAADQTKWVEIFQVAHPFGQQARLYNAGDRHELITPKDMKFECAIHGTGAPVKFSVEYRMVDHDSFTVTLARPGEDILDRKSFKKQQ